MSKATFYNRLRKHASVLVRCPQCETEMSFDRFYREHVSERHKLNSGKVCVFCFGEYAWKRGEKLKLQTFKHLVECLKQFLASNSVLDDEAVEAPANEEAVAEPETPTDNDEAQTSEREAMLLPVCRDKECQRPSITPRDMFGRRQDRTSKLVGLYDPVFEKNDMWEPRRDGDERDWVRFDESCGLGVRAYGIFKTYRDDDRFTWYHVMIKHSGFDVFVRKMSPIQDRFVVLPYWCLCDGLKTKDCLSVTHRHMIVASDDSREFERVWRKEVRYELPGDRGSKVKRCVLVRDAKHLGRTLCYVSRLKSSCNKGIPDELERSDRLSHFCVNCPVSRHGIAFFCTMYEDGVENLLSEQNRNKDVTEWESSAVKGGRSNNWKVPIGVTGWKFENCVIPVAKNYEPTTDEDEDETDFSLYLSRRKRLGFKRNDRLLEMGRDEWLAHQRSKGNTFRTVSDDWYVLSKHQQNVMNQLKRKERAMESQFDERERRWSDNFSRLREATKRKCDALESEKSEWKRKVCIVEEENVELKSKLRIVEEERDVVKNENVELKNEVAELKRQVLIVELNALKSELSAVKSELSVIKAENAALKAENAELRAENAELRAENAALRVENAALRAENAVLRVENAKLKDWCAKLTAENAEWKRRFEELEKRLVNLEFENTELKKKLGDKA